MRGWVFLLIVAILSWAGTATAQVRVNPSAPSGASVGVGNGTPVDQAVGDLDPLAHSLRRVEPGNARFSPNAALRRYDSPLRGPNGAAMPQHYVYTAPGVRAFISRPDYLVLAPRLDGSKTARDIAPAVDGGFVPLIPANTVFDLTPGPPRPVSSPSDHPRDRPAVSHRLNARMRAFSGARLDTRLNGRIRGRLPGRLARPLRGGQSPGRRQRPRSPDSIAQRLPAGTHVKAPSHRVPPLPWSAIDPRSPSRSSSPKRRHASPAHKKHHEPRPAAGK